MVNDVQDVVDGAPALLLAALVGVGVVEALDLRFEGAEDGEVLSEDLARRAEGRHDQGVLLVHTEIFVSQALLVVLIFYGLVGVDGQAVEGLTRLQAKVRYAPLWPLTWRWRIAFR